MNYNYKEDLNNKDCFELLDLCKRNLIDLNKEQVNFLVNRIFINSGFRSINSKLQKEQIDQLFKQAVKDND